uniref:Uncharacterized protein n=1 Tax=Asparagus officinalis TaxID=4686 RepID=Q2AA71_ASPOF|nr:hypothetical protein 18.t00006 [Asparagus officinalis]
MNSTTEPIPDANKLATTVGANGLAAETVVSQPIKILVESTVEYEFDQAKFEEYLSSSSSKSSSPHKCRKISSSKNVFKFSTPSNAIDEDSRLIVAEDFTRNTSARNDSYLVKESSNQSPPALTKRARQRQRQRHARQIAKALEQTDEVRYHADLESRRHRVVQLSQQPITHISAKLTTDEWIFVKRARSTLKERIQKRRANAALARTLLQQTVAKEPPKLCKHSEPVKTPHPQGGGSKCVTPDITLDRSKAIIIYPENANKALHPQKKTCLPKDIVMPGRSYQQTIGFYGNHTDESYYQVGGVNKIRKRIIREISSHCSYARLIRAVLSEYDYAKREAIPQRVSVFHSLFTEMSKPKPRCFSKKLAIQEDELPEVTINMDDKGKSKWHSSESNPDFSPGGKVNSRISQRMYRLQLGAIRRRDYKRIHEGMSSEDELSDTCSAIASNDTVSSTGQTREVLTITSDQFAQRLQEALEKKREEIRTEMKTEMELAIQQMRELLAQRSQPPESSRHIQNVIDDSDPEVDEVIMADTPPNSNNARGGLTHPPNNDIRGGSMAPLTGGGLTHSPQHTSNEDIDDDEKMKELKDKVNALMTAQEVKKTGIPCPYPRE